MSHNNRLGAACTLALMACAALLGSIARADADTSGGAARGDAAGASAGARPNIVFVLSDDQRADCIGAAGNPNIHTPAVDRLASQGINFRQATIHVPQCSPSRATLLTGLAPHQHGWFSNQAAESDRTDHARLQGLPMLPKLLKSAGYRTVLVGKWHLIPEPWDCGFSEIRTWLPPGSGPYENVRLAHGNSRKRTLEKGFTNEIFGDDAVAFLNSEDAKKQPFFLWLALTAPHSPYKPNPPDIEKLYAGKSESELMPPGFPRDRDAGDWQHYDQACTMADRQLEHVLHALDERGLSNNTMVIYLGDNGYLMGERDIAQLKRKKPFIGKVFPYEASVRVPLIVRMPDGKKIGPSDAPVSSLDLPPTMLKVAGVEPPKQWPGRDLTPLLAGRGAAGVDEAFCEFADNESQKFGDIAYRLVRTPTHKLIIYQSRPDELYDLRSDPMESKNLLGDPSVKTVQDDLHQRLENWMRKTNDPALNWKK